MTFRSEERATSEELLKSRWMKEWALLHLKGMAV